MSEEAAAAERAGLSQEHMRENVIRHAFGGDASRYEAFCEAIRAAVPPDTAAVMRGSAITGVRWNDGARFDGDGPGTSDLDLTFVGSEVLDGTPTWVYQYTTNIKGPPALKMSSKSWIGIADNLPRKTEQESKPGQKTTVTYYDYNANITINAPI